MIRKYLGFPGVELNVGPKMANKKLPHPDPTHRGLPIGMPKMIGSANIVLQTPDADPRSKLGTKPTPGTSDVQGDVIKRVVGSVKLYRPDALATPSGAVKDYMAPADFATAIASRLTYAQKNGQRTLVIDFRSQYANATPADRKAVKQSAKNLAATVAAEMARTNPAFAAIRIDVRI